MDPPHNPHQGLRAHQCAYIEAHPRAPSEDGIVDVLSSGEESQGEGLSSAGRRKLAKELGVSEESLRRLGLGFQGFAYTIPMQDGDGRIVGYRQRPAKDPGTKLTKAGGHLGLFIPEGVTPATVELVCESETDLAAGLALGFDGIATPGATSKLDLAAAYLGRALAPCPTICFDADSTGVTGAEALAGLLAARGVPCRVLTPPEPFGDLREWYLGGLDAETLAKAIEKAPIQYPPNGRHGFGMNLISNSLIDRGLLRQAGPTATAVLLAIGSFARKDGSCRVTREQLTRTVGMDRATVDRANKRLRALGVLTWDRGGRSRPNVYRLRLGPCQGTKQVYPAR